jgi:hypothetical protein
MRYGLVVLIPVLLCVIGCGEDQDDIFVDVSISPPPHRVVMIGGDGQSGEPGSVTDEPLLVRVVSVEDVPVENVSVFFNTSLPHRVDDRIVVSDANGLAFSAVHFGDRAGGFTVEASVPELEGSPVVFTLSTIGDASTVESQEIGQLVLSLSMVNLGSVFGEYLQEITLVDDLAFIPTGAHGDGIRVIDLQDPAAPRLVGQVGELRSRDAAVQGDWLYSVSGNDFHTVDITNPLSPVLIGSLELNPSSGAAAVTVAVSGNFAFVTGGGPYLGNFSALQSIDITDPANPVLGGNCPKRAGADVVLNGGYAYVAAYDEGLYIFDTSNPSAPMPLVGSVGTGGNATRLLWRDDHVYVLNTTATPVSIAVIDVSAPVSPTLVTTVDIPRHWYYSGYYPQDREFVGMTLDGDRLYVGGNEGVVVVDVSDAAAPDPLGRVDPRGFVGGVASLNGKVVVAHMSTVTIIEIVPITMPES